MLDDKPCTRASESKINKCQALTAAVVYLGGSLEPARHPLRPISLCCVTVCSKRAISYLKGYIVCVAAAEIKSTLHTRLRND